MRGRLNLGVKSAGKKTKPPSDLIDVSITSVVECPASLIRSCTIVCLRTRRYRHWHTRVSTSGGTSRQLVAQLPIGIRRSLVATTGQFVTRRARPAVLARCASQGFSKNPLLALRADSVGHLTPIDKLASRELVARAGGGVRRLCGGPRRGEPPPACRFSDQGDGPSRPSSTSTPVGALRKAS